MKWKPAPQVTEQDDTDKDDVQQGEADERADFADDGLDEAQALASVYGEDSFADAAE